MKLAVRLFALVVVLAGAVAANSIPKSAPFVSHQASTMPGPVPCGPHGCSGDRGQ
jgi:hypothetical protein